MLSLQAICNYYKFPPPQLRPSWGAGCRRKNRRRLLHEKREKRWKFSCKKHSHSQLLMIYWLCCHISCHSDNLLALFDVFFLLEQIFFFLIWFDKLFGFLLPCRVCKLHLTLQGWVAKMHSDRQQPETLLQKKKAWKQFRSCLEVFLSFVFWMQNFTDKTWTWIHMRCSYAESVEHQLRDSKTSAALLDDSKALRTPTSTTPKGSEIASQGQQGLQQCLARQKAVAIEVLNGRSKVWDATCHRFLTKSFKVATWVQYIILVYSWGCQLPEGR